MILGLFVVAVLAAAPASGGTPFEHVVAAERAFAADAIREGHHAAFVTAFAEDGVVFDPTPTNARAKHAGKPRASGTLFWDPAWAAVSRSGDLGFTSGPWQYKEPGDGAPPPATGWFFTAWRKQPDGSFKVEADLGVSAPLSYAAPGDVVDASPASTGAPAPRPSSAANARVAIVHAERLLARAATSGIGAAVLAVAEPSLRVYRDGVLPATDTDGARKLLAADTRQADCVFARVVASASGDLGYAYGTCTSSKKDKKFGYLRVWHRQADGNWSVLVDVTP